MVGRWSDAYGRRPFLIVTFIFASMPVLVLFFNLHYNTSMYFYYPAQVSFCFNLGCMFYMFSFGGGDASDRVGGLQPKSRSL